MRITLKYKTCITPREQELLTKKYKYPTLPMFPAMTEITFLGHKSGIKFKINTLIVKITKWIIKENYCASNKRTKDI